MNTEQQPEQPPTTGARLARAVTWTLATIIRFLIVAILIFGLAAAIQFGFQQLDNRLDTMRNRINLFDGDVARLMENDSARRQELREIRDELESMTGDQSELDQELGGLAANVTSQDERLATLETETAALASSSDTLTQGLGDLGAGLVAVQGDASANSGRLDELGGQIDDQQATLTGLESQLGQVEAALEAPNDDLARLQEALALFRVWELVARARLRLVEDNPGMAESDVALALAGAEALLAQDEAAAAAMEPVQLRLTLSLESLPDDPEAAARDLEAAWEEIDRLLAAMVLPETAPLATPETEQAEETTAASTPQPTPQG